MRKITYLSSLILIFLVPWEDSISTQSLGSLARLWGIVVAGLWVGTILIEGKFRNPSLFHALALLFFLWNIATVFWSIDIETTIPRIETYGQLFLLMLICWDVFQKHEHLMAALQAYVFGAYVLVISTVYNYLAGNVAVQYEGRYSATGVNANDVALVLILGLPIGLPFAMQLFFAASTKVAGILLRVINLLYIPLAIFSIVLTGTRTSIIAIVPFSIFMIGTQRIKLRQKILVSVMLLVSLLVLLPFIPQSVITRLGTVGSSITDADLGGRVNMWRSSIEVLTEHPILGVGSGAIDQAIGGAVHNTFISVITETGFIGFLLFLATLGFVVNAMAQMPKRTSALWLTIFLTWVIGVLSLSWEFRKVTWVLLSFIVIESSLGSEVAELEGNTNFSPGIPRTLKASKFSSLES